MLLRFTDLYESYFHEFKMLESVLVKIRYYYKGIILYILITIRISDSKKKHRKKFEKKIDDSLNKSLWNHVTSKLLVLSWNWWKKVKKISLELKQKYRTGDTFIYQEIKVFLLQIICYLQMNNTSKTYLKFFSFISKYYLQKGTSAWIAYNLNSLSR